MRSLVVTVDAPFARNGGAAMRNQQTIRALAALGPVDVVSLGAVEGGPIEGVDEHLAWSRDELRSHRSPAERLAARYWQLRPGGHWFLSRFRSRQASEELASLVARTPPDVVVASQWPTAEYAFAAARGSCPLVFDTHNVEVDLRRSLGRREDLADRRLHRWERHLGHRSDQVWVCSDDDASRWVEEYPDTGVPLVVPNTVSVPDVAGSAPRDPFRILYCGTLSYAPNVTAVQELVEEILPRIRRTHPRATVDIIGRDPLPAALALHAPDAGVRVLADVPDMAPHLASAGVLVVPLRAGGGTRLKILEALAAGLPVVTTAKGSEGIEVVDDVHVLMAETPEGLAAAAVRLIEDPGLAARLRADGRRLVEDGYSSRRLEGLVGEAMAALVGRVPSRREVVG